MQTFNSCAPLVVLRVKRHTVGCSKPVAAPSCGYLGDIPIVQEACATLIGDACHSALYCQPPVHQREWKGEFSRSKKCSFQTWSGASGDRLRGLAQRRASSASFFMLLTGFQRGRLTSGWSLRKYNTAGNPVTSLWTVLKPSWICCNSQCSTSGWGGRLC